MNMRRLIEVERNEEKPVGTYSQYNWHIGPLVFEKMFYLYQSIGNSLSCVNDKQVSIIVVILKSSYILLLS